MDILEARKKAKQQQEKTTPKAESSGQLEQKEAREEELSAPPIVATASTHEEEKRSEQQSLQAKEKRKKAPKEKKSSEPEKKNTLPHEIPESAKAPEELELAPQEFHELPGTQEMPELPEIPEEELKSSVSLGDIPSPKTEEPTQPPKETVKLTSEAVELQTTTPSVLTGEEKTEEAHIEDLELATITGGGEFEEEKEKKSDISVEMPLEFLSFMLGKEEYAIPLQRISEIIKPRPITEVPRLPQFVLGILTLRGVVIPVFDLSMKLSLGGVVPNKRNRIIIVNQNGERVGLLVDIVKDVVRILPRDIEPPPPVMSGVDTQYIEGVGRALDSDGLRQVLEKGEREEEKKTETTKKKRMLILLNLERVVEL